MCRGCTRILTQLPHFIYIIYFEMNILNKIFKEEKGLLYLIYESEYIHKPNTFLKDPRQICVLINLIFEPISTT